MVEFLEEKEIKVNGIPFIISKIPAVDAREIFSKYTSSNIPKVGEYEASEKIMLKMMTYVARIGADGEPVRLMTRTLVNNHVPDWETLVKLEWEMLKYNCSFFQNGKASDFLTNIARLAESKASEMLMGLLRKSSQAGKQRSEN